MKTSHSYKANVGGNFYEDRIGPSFDFYTSLANMVPSSTGVKNLICDQAESGKMRICAIICAQLAPTALHR